MRFSVHGEIIHEYALLIDGRRESEVAVFRFYYYTVVVVRFYNRSFCAVLSVGDISAFRNEVSLFMA